VQGADAALREGEGVLAQLGPDAADARSRIRSFHADPAALAEAETALANLAVRKPILEERCRFLLAALSDANAAADANERDRAERRSREASADRERRRKEVIDKLPEVVGSLLTELL
jgi:hypothetical protein